MQIVVGSDHAAFEAKEALKAFLANLKHEPIDVGTLSSERCDYSDFAKLGVAAVLERNCLGILLCGSGLGISMAANRYAGIRAAVCRSVLEAQLSRQHNDANILCLGSRINTQGEMEVITKAWLDASFEGGRHLDRIAKFDKWGEKL